MNTGSADGMMTAGDGILGSNPVPPLRTGLSLVKFLNCSVPQFPFCKLGIIILPTHRVW